MADDPLQEQLARDYLAGLTGLAPPPRPQAPKPPDLDRPPEFKDLGQSEYASIVARIADELGVERDLALSVAANESSFNPRAVSRDEKTGEPIAYGLMQLTPATQQRFGVTDPFDPEQNARGGVTYLRDLLKMFDGDRRLAVAGYHAGEHRIKEYGGIPPADKFPKTTEYVRRVLAGGAAASPRDPQEAPTRGPSTVGRSIMSPTGQQLIGSLLQKRRSMRPQPPAPLPKAPGPWDLPTPQTRERGEESEEIARTGDLGMAPGVGAPGAPAQVSSRVVPPEELPPPAPPDRPGIEYPYSYTRLSNRPWRRAGGAGLPPAPSYVAPEGATPKRDLPMVFLREMEIMAKSALRLPADAYAAFLHKDANLMLERPDLYVGTPTISRAGRVVSTGTRPTARDAAEQHVLADAILGATDALFSPPPLKRFEEKYEPKGPDAQLVSLTGGIAGAMVSPALRMLRPLGRAARTAVLGDEAAARSTFAGEMAYRTHLGRRLAPEVARAEAAVRGSDGFRDVLRQASEARAAGNVPAAVRLERQAEQILMDARRQVAATVVDRKTRAQAAAAARAVMREAAIRDVGRVRYYGAQAAASATEGFYWGAASTALQKDETPEDWGKRILGNAVVTAPIFAFYAMTAQGLQGLLRSALGARPPTGRWAAIFDELQRKNKTGEPMTRHELDLWYWVYDYASARGQNVYGFASVRPGMTPPPGESGWRPPTARPTLPPGPERPLLPTASGPPGEAFMTRPGAPLLPERAGPTALPWLPPQGEVGGPPNVPQPGLADYMRGWMPWISEGEINSVRADPQGLMRLIDVAKSRMAAYRESYLTKYATPEERASLQRPGAPRLLILKAIEDRLAIPVGFEATRSEDADAVVGDAVTTLDPELEQKRLEEIAGFFDQQGQTERPVPEPTPAPVRGWVEEPGSPDEEASAAERPPRVLVTPAPREEPPAPGAPPGPPPTAPGPAPEPAPFQPTPGGFSSADEEAKAVDDIRNFFGEGGEQMGVAPAPGGLRSARAGDLKPGQSYIGQDGETYVVMGGGHGAGGREVIIQRKTGKGGQIVLHQDELVSVERDLGTGGAITFHEKPAAPAPVPAPGPRPTKKVDKRDTWLAQMDPMTREVMENAPFQEAQLKTYLGDEGLSSLRARFPFDWIVSKTGRALDEVADEIATRRGQAFSERDIIDTIMKLERSGKQKGAVVSKKFGKPHPDLSLTGRVAAGDLQAGQSFVAIDGLEYHVRSTGERVVLETMDAATGMFRQVMVPPGELVPIYLDTTFGEPGPINIPKQKGYGLEIEEPGGGRYSAETDALSGLPQNIRESLVKYAVGQWARGVTTEAAMTEALVKAFGPKIQPLAATVYQKVKALPFVQQRGTGVKSPPEAPPNVPAPQPGPAVPPGAPAGGGVRPAPGGGRGGVHPGPAGPQPPAPQPQPAPAGGKDAGATKPRTINVHGEQHGRLLREGGVATVAHKLLPPVSPEEISIWYPEAELQRLASRLKRRPLIHQQEDVVRAFKAFLKGHAFIESSSTGTGKTTVAGMLIDRYLRTHPRARILYISPNKGLVNQATKDTFAPLGIGSHLYLGGGLFSKNARTVNFATYKRLQLERDANGIQKVIDWNPDLLVFDESQELRNAYSGTVRALAALEMMETAALTSRPHVFFMSATPFESILHTKYAFTALRFGHPNESWEENLYRLFQIRYDEAEDHWEKLSSKKLAAWFELMYRSGRMVRNELDFGSIKDKKGNKLSLTSEYVFIKPSAQHLAHESQIDSAFEALYEAIQTGQLGRKRAVLMRLAKTVYYVVRRSFDENMKLESVVEAARASHKAGKSVIIALFRKSDTSIDKWLEEYEKGERPQGTGNMPVILQYLAGHGISMKSPVKTLLEAFPDAGLVTGDQPAGGRAREHNVESFMSNRVRTLIMTIHAGGAGLDAHDKIGNGPRDMFVVSAPDTAMQTVQVAGRAFRLGSQSNARIIWTFIDNESDHRLADKNAHRLRSMHAIIRGAVNVPEADRLLEFEFPEIDTIVDAAGEIKDPPEEGGSGGAPGGSVASEPIVERRTKAGASRRTAIDELKQNILENPLYELPDDIRAAYPEVAKHYDAVREIRSQVTGSEASAREIDAAKAEADEPPELAPNSPTGRAFIPGHHMAPSTTGTRTREQIKTRKQILRAMEKAFHVRSFRGWMRARKGTRAYYVVQPEVVRKRLELDVETMAHEIAGHHLSKLIWGTEPGKPGQLMDAKTVALRRFALELRSIATRGNPISEGFAEFMRLYITQPGRAQSAAPTFYPWMDAKLQAEFPELHRVMMALRDDWKQFHEGTPEAIIATTIESSFTPGGRIPHTSAWQDVRKMMEDDTHYARYFTDLVLKQGGVRAISEAIDPRVLMSTVNDRHAMAQAWLDDGPFMFHSPDHIVGESAGKIFKELGNRLVAYDTYAKARRALNILQQRGRDPFEAVGIYEEHARAVVQKYDREFGPIFKRVERQFRTLLQYGVSAGLMSGDTFDKIVTGNRDYSPLLRIIEKEPGNPFYPGGSALGNLPTPWKRLKGSDLPTMPVFEALYKMTHLVVDRAERNAAAAAWLYLAKKIPGIGSDFVHEVPRPTVPVAHVSFKEIVTRMADELGISAQMVQHLLNGTGLTPEEVNALLPIFRPSWFIPEKPYMWVWQHGSPTFVKFNEELYDTLQFTERHPQTDLGKLFSIPVALLRMGAATLYPAFYAVRSPLRDIPTGLMQTDDMAKFIAKLPGSFVAAFFGTDIARKYARSGGYTSTFMQPRRDLMLIEQRRQLAKNEGNKWETLKLRTLHGLVRLMNALAHVGNSIELGPRIAEARVQGLETATGRPQMLRAGFAGREITQDFNRIGTVVRVIGRYAAFFPARVQAYWRFAREWKSQPLRALWRLLLVVGIPTFFAYLLGRKDERWQNVDQRVRDQNWVIFLPPSIEAKVPWWRPGDYVRIPKPGTWGDVATAFERQLESIEADDPELMDRYGKDLLMQSPFFYGWIPTAVLPLAELGFNQRFYSGAPVSPERGEPGEQYWDWTSPLAKDIGRETGIGGARIEHLVGGYAGGIGRASFGLVSKAYEKATGQERTRPPSRTADVPVVGTLFGSYPGSSDEPVRRFYELYEPIREAVETMGRKSGREPSGVAPYLRRRIGSLAIGDIAEVARDLSELRQAQQAVISDPSTSPDEKRARLKELRLSQNHVAKIGVLSILQARESVEAATRTHKGD